MNNKLMQIDNDKVVIVLPGIIKILDKWTCSLHVKQALLGFSNEEKFQDMLSKPSAYTFSNEQIKRMSYLLTIYRSLHTILSDGQRADNWVNTPNTAPLFRGQPAIEILKKGRMRDLALVAQYLQSF